MEVSLPSDFLVAARKKAIEKLGESLEIAGFRFEFERAKKIKNKIIASVEITKI